MSWKTQWGDPLILQGFALPPSPWGKAVALSDQERAFPIPLFRAENGDNKGELPEHTKKSLENPLNQSKVHKKSAAKKKFLGKVEKILKIFDFLIDFREKLSYNRGCMERETGP